MQNVATIKSPEPVALDLDQLDEVSGGSSTEWGVATGTAAALTVGAATVTAPVLAGVMAVGGIVSAGLGIYYALEEWGTDG